MTELDTFNILKYRHCALTNIKVDDEWVPRGAIYWINNDGQLHSHNDQPSNIWPDGTKFWYRNGKLHREDGPAIEYPDGSKHWYRNDKRHRENGPAIEYIDGSMRWYINGFLIN